MNLLLQPFITIPLTHLLLIVTFTTIGTIWAAAQHCIIYATIACAFIAGYCIYKNKLQALVLLFCVIASSLIIIARMHQQRTIYQSDQSFLKTKMSLTGTVKQINRSNLAQDQTNIIVQTNAIWNAKRSLKAPKKIALFFPSAYVKDIQEGDVVTVSDIKLEQPLVGGNYERYFIKEGFWATARCATYTPLFVQKNNCCLKTKILIRIQQHLPDHLTCLFDPLFLGKKEKNLQNLEIQHKSAYWGIAHHMARSGLHLSILLSLILLLLHYTYMPYFLRYLLCISMLLGYTIISQSSISFLRALCMILLHLFGKLCKQTPSGLHTLTITTLITLFFNPLHLFFLDFQLSFGITYIILWLFNIKNSKTIAFYQNHLIRF